MTVPAGLAESAAATLLRLMVAELAGVDVGYVDRFAALDTTGDPQAARNVAARLTIDARCLEAALTASASEVTDMAPTAIGDGLHPLSPAQVHDRWEGLIEGALARGLVRAADLNAFLAAFAAAAEDGHELLRIFIELDRHREAMWHHTRRSTVLPGRDLDELRRLDTERRQAYAKIRGRYPVAVHADHVQTALQRQYEAQRAELVATRPQYTTPEDQAGFAMALEHLDSAHELALRRQSVPQYAPDETTVPPAPSGPLAAAVGQVQESVVAQMEEQRAMLLRMRDQNLTAAGRAGYDQAIAQIDIGIRTLARQPTITPEAESAMTDDQRRAVEQAIADAAKATASLDGLGAVTRAASARGDHMLERMNVLAALNADLYTATRKRDTALRAELDAKAAVDRARLSGIRSDHQAAVRHHEQARRRHEAVNAEIAEIQARIDEHGRQAT